MKEINIGKNILSLRRKNGITQEQLASALNISPQAVSKWETNTAQPDTLILPLIADYFNVSIDYLFYGQKALYEEIYDDVFEKVSSNPHMSSESFEDVLNVFGYAHHGISTGNLIEDFVRIDPRPAQLSNENGVSLLAGIGYGAILTRSFFEHVTPDTAEFAASLLPVLADKNAFLVCMAILSMSDISFTELQEKLHFADPLLRNTLDCLIGAKIVKEKESKHKSLGLTYEINLKYHACLCVLIATIEMQRYSLKGMACCIGYGDYPIQLNLPEGDHHAPPSENSDQQPNP